MALRGSLQGPHWMLGLLHLSDDPFISKWVRQKPCVQGHQALRLCTDPGVLCRWEDPVGDTRAELPAPEATSPDQLRLHHQGCAPGLPGGQGLCSFPFLGLRRVGGGKEAAGIQTGAPDLQCLEHLLAAARPRRLKLCTTHLLRLARRVRLVPGL